MATTNLSSSNIAIFPIGANRTEHEFARVLNEQNLTNVFKNLTSKDKYVLSFNNPIIEFVLDGYFISADITEVNASLNLYAKLVYDNSNNQAVLSDQPLTPVYLEGDDANSSRYGGVEFTTDHTSDESWFPLLLDGKVVNTYRYNAEHIDFTNIQLIRCQF